MITTDADQGIYAID